MWYSQFCNVTAHNHNVPLCSEKEMPSTVSDLLFHIPHGSVHCSPHLSYWAVRFRAVGPNQLHCGKNCHLLRIAWLQAILQAEEAPPEASMCLGVPRTGSLYYGLLRNRRWPSCSTTFEHLCFLLGEKLGRKAGVLKPEGSLALKGPLIRP